MHSHSPSSWFSNVPGAAWFKSLGVEGTLIILRCRFLVDHFILFLASVPIRGQIATVHQRGGVCEDRRIDIGELEFRSQTSVGIQIDLRHPDHLGSSATPF